MTQTPYEVQTLLQLLARLPDYLENNWFDLGEGRGYFGDGTSGENGIRTNTNVVFSLAVLLKNADTCGLNADVRTVWRARLADLVRYLVSSHVHGTGNCADGGKWGLSWQSSWWATKLALGADVAGDALDTSEVEAARRIISLEASRHLERLIPTGLAQDTKAEENAWDAESLAAAISLSSPGEDVGRWRQRLVEFSVNTFSRPSDQYSHATVDGVAIRDVLKSCNIHNDGSLENHGAAHFCYVASPLLSKAFCAYALQRKGKPVPIALNWNVDHVWGFAEPTFLKNRFAYIGGQDWARYTYGEYFILPALLYLASIGRSKKTIEIFNQRLHLLHFEAKTSDDGSFFGGRFTKGNYQGQFAKYETDCFSCVALALDMMSHFSFDDSPVQPEPDKIHISHESLTCYARQGEGFFSFSWQTLESHLPNITFVPLADDSLAEWHAGNLIGSIWMPRTTMRWVGVKSFDRSDKGLRIEGEHVLRAVDGTDLARHYLSVELNGGVLSVVSRFVAASKLRAVHLTGIDWHIPNDLFNGHKRHYFSEGPDGAIVSLTSIARNPAPFPAKIGPIARLKRKLRLDGQMHAFGASRWLNIDDQIGIFHRGTDRFVLSQFGHKIAPWNSLNIERVQTPASGWRFNVVSGTVLLDSEFTLHLGSHKETRDLAKAS